MSREELKYNIEERIILEEREYPKKREVERYFREKTEFYNYSLNGILKNKNLRFDFELKKGIQRDSKEEKIVKVWKKKFGNESVDDFKKKVKSEILSYLNFDKKFLAEFQCCFETSKNVFMIFENFEFFGTLDEEKIQILIPKIFEFSIELATYGLKISKIEEDNIIENSKGEIKFFGLELTQRKKETNQNEILEEIFTPMKEFLTKNKEKFKTLYHLPKAQEKSNISSLLSSEIIQNIIKEKKELGKLINISAIHFYTEQQKKDEKLSEEDSNLTTLLEISPNSKEPGTISTKKMFKEEEQEMSFIDLQTPLRYKNYSPGEEEIFGIASSERRREKEDVSSSTHYFSSGEKKCFKSLRVIGKSVKAEGNSKENFEGGGKVFEKKKEKHNGFFVKILKKYLCCADVEA